MDTIDLLNDISTEQKPDARARTSKANGKAFAGRPVGVLALHADKRVYDADKLAENLADRILAGGNLPASRAGPPTQADKEHVARIAGEPIEVFQARFLGKLMEIADKAGNRIIERLDEGGQRLSDLNMTLAISVDKMAAISGRTAQAGNVSVTVNNYGAMSRSEMLATVAAEAKHASIEV